MGAVIHEDDGGTKKKTLEKMKQLSSYLNVYVAYELDKIWKDVEDDARIMCPFETGSLRDTIRTIKSPIGQLTGNWSRVKEVKVFDRTLVAGDETKSNYKTGRPVNYATWVHDGHNMRDGSFWEGVPFLAEALAKNDGKIMRAIENAEKKAGIKFSEGGRN